MTKMFLSLFLLMNSLIMLFMNNPLSMGLMILTQTLLMCLLSGMMIKTYWFSYILFLTFLGGLLVLFIYVTSIASNEMFNSSSYIIFFFMIMMFMTFFLMMNYWHNLNWMNFSFNNDMNNFYSFLNSINLNKNMMININLNKLYNNQTFLMMMMMVIYLFITLLAVVKITNIFYGPLRCSN